MNSKDLAALVVIAVSASPDKTEEGAAARQSLRQARSKARRAGIARVSLLLLDKEEFGAREIAERVMRDSASHAAPNHIRRFTRLYCFDSTARAAAEVANWLKI